MSNVVISQTTYFIRCEQRHYIAHELSRVIFTYMGDLLGVLSIWHLYHSTIIPSRLAEEHDSEVRLQPIESI